MDFADFLAGIEVKNVLPQKLELPRELPLQLPLPLPSSSNAELADFIFAIKIDSDSVQDGLGYESDRPRGEPLDVQWETDHESAAGNESEQEADHSNDQATEDPYSESDKERKSSGSAKLARKISSKRQSAEELKETALKTPLLDALDLLCSPCNRSCPQKGNM